jgi:hypothetical protein
MLSVGTLQLDLFTPVDVVLDMIAQERSSGMNEGQVSPNISSPPPQPSPLPRLEHAVSTESKEPFYSSRYGSPSALPSSRPSALHAPLSPRQHNAKDATKPFSKDPSVQSTATVSAYVVVRRPKGSKNKKTLEKAAAMRAAAAAARTPPPDDDAAGPSEPVRREKPRASGPPKVRRVESEPSPSPDDVRPSQRLAEDEEIEAPAEPRRGRPRKQRKRSPSI